MTTYRATTESGHIVIIHGARALKTYRADVTRGEAEPLLRVVAATVSRDEHARLQDAGQCYGPCSLAR